MWAAGHARPATSGDSMTRSLKNFNELPEERLLEGAIFYETFSQKLFSGTVYKAKPRCV